MASDIQTINITDVLTVQKPSRHIAYTVQGEWQSVRPGRSGAGWSVRDECDISIGQVTGARDGPRGTRFTRTLRGRTRQR
jgi:hypothetical protein